MGGRFSRPEFNSRPELAELENEVRSNKWEEIGLQLGLKDSDLVAIRQQWGGNVSSCRREMFRLWLETNPKASRKQLLAALRENAVTEMYTAEQYETYIRSHFSQRTQHTVQDLSHTQVNSIPSPLDSTNEQSISPHHIDRKIVISEKYHPEFGRKRVDLILLISKIKEILKTKGISLDDLKSFLEPFHELRDATASLEEVIKVVCDHTSLINTTYLIDIAERFQLPDAVALIKQYDNSIDEFCKKIPTTHSYGQEFMMQSSRHIQQSETIEFVLEWHDDDTTLSDIQGLLRKAFHDHTGYMMVIRILPINSIRVVCYAPLHYHKALTELLNENEVVLRKEGVLSVTVGGSVILKREPEDKKTQLSGIDSKQLTDEVMQDGEDLQSSQLRSHVLTVEEQERLDEDLLLAVEKQNIAETDRLMTKGANPNKKHDLKGRTPLHWASKEGHADIVCLLVSHGADINIKDNRGRSPLDLANESSNQEVVKILQEQQKKLEDIDSKNSSAFAIFLLRQHFDSLYQSIHNPMSVAEKLSIEGVFDKQFCDEDCMTNPSLKQIFMYTLREAVCLSCDTFKVFASILLKYKSTVSIAQKLIKEYNEHLIKSSPLESLPDVQEPSKYMLHTKSTELDAVFDEVQLIFEVKLYTLNRLVPFLSTSFPEFEIELEECRTIQEVFDIARTYTSLDNLSYLEAITDKFELQECSDTLKKYRKSTNELYEETLVSESYDHNFMHHFTRYPLKEERITLVVEVNKDNTYTLMDIRHLLDKVFLKMACHIKLMRLADNDGKVHVLCYAPFHLIHTLVGTVKEHKAILKAENVLTLNIGGVEVDFLKKEQSIFDLEKENQTLKADVEEKGSTMKKRNTGMKSELKSLSKESLEQKSAGTAAKQLLSYKQTELKNIQEVADSLSSEIKKKEISTLLKQKNTELEKEESELQHLLEIEQVINKKMEFELENIRSDTMKSNETDITGILKKLEIAKELFTQSLDKKRSKLEELHKESDSLTSLLKRKEEELTQLKLEKMQHENKDDVYVVDEEVLTVTGDDECTLHWRDHGLRIDIPKGSIPSGCSVELQVQAIVAGRFILPPDCHLVSSIYWINCPQRFDKKVILHLSHAAIIESQEEASYFRFYAAKCSSGPPYEFKELKDASFMPFSDSASIKLSQFSYVAVGSCKLPRQRYYSQVFYKLKQPYSEWDMLFVMIKEDLTFQKFVGDKYLDYYEGVDQIVKLKEDATSIKLKPDSNCLDQWKMTEIIASEIDVEDIDYFTPERTLHVPHCHFNFCWKSGLPVKPLNMKIDLEGADRPADFFRVILPQEVPQGTVRRITSSPHNVVKSHLPKLLEATTDPDRLANDMSAVDLISGSIKAKVLTTSGLSNYDKASALLEEFLHYLKVYNEAQTLESFCTVLTQQDNPALKRISEEILHVCSTYT